MNGYLATIRSRCEMSLSELTEFASIIYSYGAVKGTLAEITDRVLKVEAICYVRMGNRMVATAALKQPADFYRKKLEYKTGAKVSEAQFPLEMGYVVVVEGHRGERLSNNGRLSDLVMEKVMTQAKERGVFATTKINGFVTIHVSDEELAFLEMSAHRMRKLAARSGLEDEVEELLNMTPSVMAVMLVEMALAQFLEDEKGNG